MPLVTPGLTDSVRAWDIADVYTAPTGSTAPTDTTTALNAAFVNMGLMDEEQMTWTRNVDRNELRSMGGRMVRVKRQAQSMQFSFTPLENSHEVFLRANPGSSAATATGITTRTFKSQTTALRAMVLHLVEGSIRSRLWIPSCEIFSDGDRTIGPEDKYKTPMTVVVYPGTADILMYEITDDVAAAAS